MAIEHHSLHPEAAPQYDAQVPDDPSRSILLSASSLASPTIVAPARESKVISVAISGCSSSGKTTLAVLLSEIFIVSDTSERPGLIIHQDIFFHEKWECPMTSFECTSSEDIKFCESTLRIDYVKQYKTSRMTEVNPGSELVGPSRFRITGPDTDCIAAVDFFGLVKHVEHAKDHGVLMDMNREGGENENMKAYQITTDDIKNLKRKYETIISKGKKRVERFAKEHRIANAGDTSGSRNFFSPICSVDQSREASVLPQLVFVDGFLLYTDPSKETISKAGVLRSGKVNWGSSGDGNQVEQLKHAAMASTVDRGSEGRSVDDMKSLMPLLDIKLFLPTSKQVARDRRKNRPDYIDFPHPGRRFPGQMWKTDGYFEHIVWGNYLKQHQWLVRGDGGIQNSIVDGKTPGGIEVRWTVDGSVEETVEWAVNVILRKLEQTG